MSSNSELPFELVYQETGGWRRLLKHRTGMASAGRAKDEEAEVADAFRNLFFSRGLCFLSRIFHNRAWAAGSISVSRCLYTTQFRNGLE